MGLLSSVLTVGGAVVGGAVGGPAGAKIGAAAGGAIGGAVDQSNAAKKATKIQAGAQEAADLKRQETLNQVKALQGPGTAAYYTGLNALTGRLGLPTQAVGQAIDTQTAERAPFDPKAFIAAHPDVQQAFEKASPNNLKNNLGIDATPEAYATWFYNTQGKYNPQYQMPIVSSPITGASGVVSPGGAPASAGTVTPQATNALSGAPTGPAGTSPAAVTGTPGTYGNISNPTYTDPGQFSFTADDYTASPAYQYNVDQAMQGVLAGASATGGIRSGAALKELQSRASSLANQDFDNERAFARSSYDTDRNFGRTTYENDRNYLSQRYDQGTSDLFRYTGVGQNALNSTTNAITGYGDDNAQTQLNYGDINAGNALQQGSIWSGLTSNLGGIVSSAVGGAKPGGAGSNTVPYDPSAVNLGNYKPAPLPSYSY